MFEKTIKILLCVYVIAFVFTLGAIYGQSIVKVSVKVYGKTYAVKNDVDIINTNIEIMDNNCNKIGQGRDTVSVRILKK